MKIQIWSDIACPWCYIGKRRFEQALSCFAHRNAVEVEWKSFELNPNFRTGVIVPIMDFVTVHKNISPEVARQLFRQVRTVAGAEGLSYDFDAAQHSNTFDAHRLLHFAKDRGLQDAMKERLLSAYFERGEAIGDHTVLARLAGEVGLDATQAATVLASDRYAADVRLDQAQARRLGLGGVPAFVIDGVPMISGAQKPQTILASLEQAWRDNHQSATAAASAVGGACTPDGCSI